MKMASILVLLVTLHLGTGSAIAGEVAIAYSPSSRVWGIAEGPQSVTNAKAFAGNRCDLIWAHAVNGAHAVIVADSKGRTAWGVGNTYREAVSNARTRLPAGKVVVRGVAPRD